MFELVVIVHVTAMITSLALMSSAVVMGLFGKNAAVTVATLSMVVTVLGFITGIGLLLDAPLSIKCATLTAYLVGVTVLYHVGYGFGNVQKARFVRRTS